MAQINWTEFRRSLLGDHDPQVFPPRIQLPILPHALMEFSRKAESPDACTTELGRIIESDSGLTCDLLRYVNSSKFGLRTKLSTAHQAITKLGIRNSKLFLLTAGVQHAMKACKSKLINFQAFWLTNLERALFAREVAGLLKANADVAFAGSMLHDFMLPLLSNEKYHDYFKFTQIPEQDRPPLVTYEKATFGWDHALASAQVLLAWSFPDDLISCVLLHHGGLEMLRHNEVGNTAVAAVAVAGLIPDALRQSGAGLEQLMQLDAVWPKFQLVEIAERVEQELMESTSLADQHFSLKRRCEKLLAAPTET